MPREIHISEITVNIVSKIDIVASNLIKVSFQIDGKTFHTDAATYTEGKEMKWANLLKINLAQDKTFDIKLHNDKNLLAKCIFNVPTTLQEQKNNLELFSETKELVAKITFKSNVQEITQSPKKVQQPLEKPKTQKNIPLQESPQKSQKSIQQNKDNQPQNKPKQTEKPQNNLGNSIKKEPSKKQIASTKQIKQVESTKQIKEVKDEPQSNKKIQSPQKNKQSPKKQNQIKLSDRPARKMTEKSQRKPSEKAIETQKSQKVHLQTSNAHDSSLMGNQSFNRSRDTFKLPNIGDVSKNFGDKIYEKQSSATLQKSILVFSVPKAPRFGSGPKYAGQPSYYVDTCFKPNSTKGVGFGFGNKRQFPEWMQKNMKENPAPGAYFYQSKASSSMQKKGNLTSHLHTRGPSFGISYKFYEKVTIPKQKSPQRTTVSNQRLKPLFRSN